MVAATVTQPAPVARFGLPLLAGLGLALTLYAYLPALDNYFVADDFNYLLVGREVLRDPLLIFRQQDLWELYAGAVMRPVGDLLWAGLYALGKDRAAVYYALLLALHLLNAGLVAGVLWRWLRDGVVAVLAAVLFATAYGPRNGVYWLANLNETLALTLALLLVDYVRRRPGELRTSLTAALGLVIGCLLKESLAALFVVLVVLDAGRAGGWERTAWRRWLPAAAVLGGYVAVRALPRFADIYQGAGPGPHLLRSYPALVTAAFASTLWPIYVARVLQAPELIGLLGWSTVALVGWLAIRGAPATRVLAVWLLAYPVLFSLVPSAVPEALPSHYLYAVTVPAMTLVAQGLVGLWRRAAGRPVIGLVALLLSLLLARWVWYGVNRTRYDDATHWQVAADTLRRDFALFDAAGFAPGTTIYLVIEPALAPGRGAWWGWGGYPVVSPVKVELKHFISLAEVPAEPPRPYAVYVYGPDGPELLTRVEGGAP